ncbi:YtfJ family protein [Pantoea sp.]|uniref:YtfJ family protein n=1 Tax=Pantoea sp. TaxID=69393 RepID=UPI00289B51D0|nr:YtfJ family protein [Pantoea sp.]
MKLPAASLAVCALLAPFFASAHHFVIGQRVSPVGISDKGELVLHQNETDYIDWNSARLPGKVRVLLHIAGRLSAKEMNEPVTEAIAAARLSPERYQTTIIVNTDDAIPGSALFVRSSLESSKKASPQSEFIIDSEGEAKRAWALKDGSSAVVVLDNASKVRFAKEGALTPAEIEQVITLLHNLVK